jgi:hypothetical protein
VKIIGLEGQLPLHRWKGGPRACWLYVAVEGSLACHAALFTSLTSACDRRRFEYWAFNSRSSGRDRPKSPALLKALLKDCV